MVAAAQRAGVRVLEVEITCSDVEEHRRRVEERATDVEGLVLPTWQQVLDRDYRFWDGPHLVIDTHASGVQQSVAAIRSVMRA